MGWRPIVIRAIRFIASPNAALAAGAAGGEGDAERRFGAFEPAVTVDRITAPLEVTLPGGIRVRAFGAEPTEWIERVLCLLRR